MALMDKENARLQQKQDLDEEVKRTMMPYEIEESKAKIAQTLALSALANSRAQDGADDASAAVWASKYKDGDLDSLMGRPAMGTGTGGGAPSMSRPSSSSNLAPSPSSNDPTSFSLNPITSNFSQDEETTLGKIASELPNKIPDSELDAVTNPQLSEMTASTDGAGAPVSFGPTQRNKADWDNDASNFTPLEKANPLTSLQVPDKMREDLAKANDKSGALNQPQQQAEKQEAGLGELLVGEWSKIEDAGVLASRSKGGMRARLNGTAAGAADNLARRTAYALGMDPSLGRQAMQVLLKGSNGLTRDPAAINRIVELTQKGMSLSDAAERYDLSRKIALENELKGKTVEDKTVEKTTAFLASMKSAREMPESTPEERALKQTTISTLNEKGNEATGGKFYQALHVDMENTVATAVKNMSPGGSKTKTTWSGKDFKEAVDPNDPTSNMSSYQKLAHMATTGQLPTATVSGEGWDARAADAYIKKYGVTSVPVGVWNTKTGALDMFRYDPSRDESKRFVPMTSVAPPDADAKPAKAETPKSSFTGAGEAGQRVRRAVGKVTRGLGEATQSIGNTISDLPYQAVNAASGVAEFGAGVAGYNLDIPKVDTLTEARNKLGLDNRNDFARGKMNLPTVEQIRKDQEMIANTGSIPRERPEASWVPNDKDLRADGSKKSTGFLGVHKRFDDPKQVSSEISIGVDWGDGEKEIPTMVPTINQTELQYLLSVPPDKMQSENPKLMKSITEKAIKHARERESKGLPYFK
jgi:hypothetical protein